MSRNRTVKGRVFGFDCCPYVEFWGYCMLEMCNVRDVGCSGCGMLEMWDVRDVGCSGCGMFGMWDVRDVRCSGCGMFGMCDVRDVRCSGCGMFGMWDVGCLLGCGMFIYKMPIKPCLTNSISPLPCLHLSLLVLALHQSILDWAFWKLSSNLVSLTTKFPLNQLPYFSNY